MQHAGNKKQRQQHGMDVEGAAAAGGGGDGCGWQTGPPQQPAARDDFIGEWLA